jgi:hypothetical protein
MFSQVRLEGILRHSEDAGTFVPPNEPGRGESPADLRCRRGPGDAGTGGLAAGFACLAPRPGQGHHRQAALRRSKLPADVCLHPSLVLL